MRTRSRSWRRRRCPRAIPESQLSTGRPKLTVGLRNSRRSGISSRFRTVTTALHWHAAHHRQREVAINDAYSVLRYCGGALALFLLGCLVIGLRKGDSDTDRTGPEAGQSADYWEAQVDRWLAQLAEIRNLVTLPEGADRPSTPTPTGVASAHADDTASTLVRDSTIGRGAACEPSAATKCRPDRSETMVADLRTCGLGITQMG
jgi:hypothetical protein